MSLNWNVSKIENWEDVCKVKKKDGTEKWNPVTETIVFATMFTGIPEITAKNHEEFFKRIHMFEKVNGALLQEFPEGGGQPTPVFLTHRDVKDHIGLYTNASKKTRPSFLAGVFRNMDLP